MTLTRRLLRAAVAVRRHEHGVHAASQRTLVSFASALVARRAQLGITRTALAAQVRISYGQLSHIENAENWPTMPVYLGIIRALKCGRAPLV